MEMLQLFSCFSLALFTKKLDLMFNTVLVQDGIICGDVGWWSGLNKVGSSIDEVDIGFCNTLEVMGNNI